MSINPRLRRYKDKLQKKIKKLPWIGNYYFYKYMDEGIRLKHMLMHKNIKGYPKIELIVTKDIIPTKEDLLLTERLLKAYKKAMHDGKKEKILSNQDMWVFLKKGPHAEFFDLLKTEDINAIAFYLCNMSKMGITHGITQGKSEYKKILMDSIYRRWYALTHLDKLITLAEALGLLPLEDPEQGEFGLSIFSNIDETIKKIEERLEIKIIPPNIEGGLYKLSTNKGGIHYRDISAIYTAWRCKELLKKIEIPSVCEIGAGVGKVVYYSYLFGISKYTIIDLPYINILQGFYLIKCLPSAKIFLYGEDCNDKNSILILPNWSLKKVNGKPFNIVINQDSFPEINKETVLKYLKQIKLHARDFFLSINQESRNTMMVGNLKQHIVFDLISSLKGFELIYRFPHWMRIGYTEELYRITDHNQ